MGVGGRDPQQRMDGEGMWKDVSTETKIDLNLWGGYRDSKYPLPVCAGGGGRMRKMLRVSCFYD